MSIEKSNKKIKWYFTAMVSLEQQRYFQLD